MELPSMERALLSSCTIATTPRCESSYPSPFHSFNCFYSIPLLLRMEEERRPECIPTMQAIFRRLQGDHAPQDSNNPQVGEIESTRISVLPLLCKKSNFDDTIPTMLIVRKQETVPHPSPWTSIHRFDHRSRPPAFFSFRSLYLSHRRRSPNSFPKTTSSVPSTASAALLIQSILDGT
jgi:hypothetical protein